eukprot:TRINITY_DN48386_c0_g1_i1.p1 TRINITY_DN48386_c0_g1~~TRINITY_DN48386_c0_g1_i1.p1  ORF type:complete len:525 (+),score=95.75 TRINITY_DN48386_c0_g1_i1:16-1590(+)
MIAFTPWQRPSVHCSSGRLNLGRRMRAQSACSIGAAAAASATLAVAHRLSSAARPSRLAVTSPPRRSRVTCLRYSQGIDRPTHILTACNVYKQETVLLERSALRGGYKFHAVGLGSEWHGLSTKLAVYDSALKARMGQEIAPEDPVMLMDAWDTVVLGPAEEFRAKLAALGALGPEGGVIGAGDRLCCPDMHFAPRMERLFAAVRTPFRYPNSGGFAGTCKALADFLDCLVNGSDGGVFDINGDDQLRVQVFLNARAEEGRPYPFRLDEDCIIFKCMGEPEQAWDFEQRLPADGAPAAVESQAPRIVLHDNGERPIMAHGCGGHGRWFLGDIYQELGLLEYLGVTPQDLANYQYAGLVAPGQKVLPKHWVNQPPWEWPFQNFQLQRSMALRAEAQELVDSLSFEQTDDELTADEAESEALDGEFHVVGSWADWDDFIELRLVDDKSHLRRACVPVSGGSTVEFQVLLNKDWSRRFFPLSATKHGVGGPADQHGANWKVEVPADKTKLLVTWNPVGRRSLVCEFA